MKAIRLTQNKIALVDEADYLWLSQWKWHARKGYYTWYAVRQSPKENGKQSIIRMHREILRAPPGTETDHKDHNGLNNCRNNLRIATKAENIHNRLKHRRGTSRFKGVSWRPAQRKWYARIETEKRSIYLGLFNSEINAAEAYDKAAQKLFGEFAHTNF